MRERAKRASAQNRIFISQERTTLASNIRFTDVTCNLQVPINAKLFPFLAAAKLIIIYISFQTCYIN